MNTSAAREQRANEEIDEQIYFERLFTDEEYDFLTTLLVESEEWDSDPPKELIKTIGEKLKHFTYEG